MYQEIFGQKVQKKKYRTSGHFVQRWGSQGMTALLVSEKKEQKEMESMRDVNRVMEREIKKETTPLQFEQLNFGDYSYNEISSQEKLVQVFSYLLRIGEYKSFAGKTIGNNVYMDVVSVGATINIMLAAVKAKGLTVIENAAKEPHIVDLANFLSSMGADIRGAGTDVIKIYGVDHLHGTTYSIIPDQIEAGTYMVAIAATGGDAVVENVIPKHLESISAKLEEMGVIVEEFDDSIHIKREGQLQKCNVKTMPHPGFPTDMQPQISVLLAIAHGTSIITESVWDSRFRYVEELRRMGAQFSVDGKLAVIEGVDHLNAAPVKATDLRAGAAVVIAALCAKGVSQIEEIRHIERGYEDIVEKLQKLGADIKRIHTPEDTQPKAM